MVLPYGCIDIIFRKDVLEEKGLLKKIFERYKPTEERIDNNLVLVPCAMNPIDAENEIAWLQDNWNLTYIKDGKAADFVVVEGLFGTCINCEWVELIHLKDDKLESGKTYKKGFYYEFIEKQCNHLKVPDAIFSIKKIFASNSISNLLIGGSERVGKTNLINLIILNLLSRYATNRIKLVLYNSKKDEVSMYNNLPQLIMPEVITEKQKVIKALEWCNCEIEKRENIFEKFDSKNLEGYNNVIFKKRGKKLPYIVFILDEFAGLMDEEKNKIENLICKILQKSRKVGIYLILSTQKTMPNIITGRIKANLPFRVCFSVVSPVDSKVVLDQTGAEKLTDKGSIIYSSDVDDIRKIQTGYIYPKEITNFVDHIKAKNKHFEYDKEIEKFINNKECL